MIEFVVNDIDRISKKNDEKLSKLNKIKKETVKNIVYFNSRIPSSWKTKRDFTEIVENITVSNKEFTNIMGNLDYSPNKKKRNNNENLNNYYLTTYNPTERIIIKENGRKYYPNYLDRKEKQTNTNTKVARKNSNICNVDNVELLTEKNEKKKMNNNINGFSSSKSDFMKGFKKIERIKSAKPMVQSKIIQQKKEEILQTKNYFESITGEEYWKENTSYKKYNRPATTSSIDLYERLKRERDVKLNLLKGCVEAPQTISGVNIWNFEEFQETIKNCNININKDAVFSTTKHSNAIRKENIVKKLNKLKDEKTNELFHKVNRMGPYYSHCLSCAKKNSDFYNCMNKDNAYQILNHIKQNKGS